MTLVYFSEFYKKQMLAAFDSSSTVALAFSLVVYSTWFTFPSGPVAFQYILIAKQTSHNET